MTRRFTTYMIIHLQAILYRDVNSQKLSVPRESSHESNNRQLLPRFTMQNVSSTRNTFQTPSTPSTVRNWNGSKRWFHPGQRVLAPISNFGAYSEAIIVQILPDTTVEVRYVINAVSAVVSSAELRPFKSFVQGDRVELYDYTGQRWRRCKILSIHPLGHGNFLHVDPMGTKTVINDYPLDAIRFIY